MIRLPNIRHFKHISLFIFFLTIAPIALSDTLQKDTIENFNDANGPNLGTATNGNTWSEIGETGSCYFSIISNKAYIGREDCNMSGIYAELALSKDLSEGDIVSVNFEGFNSGSTGVGTTIFVEDSTELFILYASTGEGFFRDGTSQGSGSDLFPLVSGDAPQINFTFKFSNDSVDIKSNNSGNYVNLPMRSAGAKVNKIRLGKYGSNPGDAATAKIDNIDHFYLQDTTPPSITYYNLTSSSGGCENWVTNKSNPCTTSSVAPSVQFNTNEAAFCAVEGSLLSSLTNNHTQMGSSRNCTGGASGEGTTSHYCTLPSQDQFVYEDGYLYISCKDSAGNQNRTSTSGPLRLQITGLDSSASSAIGSGVQNSLTSGFTTYTSQQIYARAPNGAQDLGRFDRVVKKGTKTWAFNYVAKGEEHVGMFNITPSFYVLEMSNITTTNITRLVEVMVNGTR